MPLMRSFKETVREMIKRDPDFANILFEEAVQAMIERDWQTGGSAAEDLGRGRTSTEINGSKP